MSLRELEHKTDPSPRLFHGIDRLHCCFSVVGLLFRMFSRAIVSAFAAAGLAAAQVPDEDGRYTISTPDIKAQFIPYGATLTNLFVKDKNGDEVDVVLGYDDVEFYREHPLKPPCFHGE